MGPDRRLTSKIQKFSTQQRIPNPSSPIPACEWMKHTAGCGLGPDQNGDAKFYFANTGDTMNVKKVISTVALFCTATMMISHAITISPSSAEPQDDPPNGLRRMVRMLQKRDLVDFETLGVQFEIYSRISSSCDSQC